MKSRQQVSMDFQQFGRDGDGAVLVEIPLHRLIEWEVRQHARLDQASDELRCDGRILGSELSGLGEGKAIRRFFRRQDADRFGSVGAGHGIFSKSTPRPLGGPTSDFPGQPMV